MWYSGFRQNSRFGQRLLPSPLKDVPIGEAVSTDPYWKSFRGWENPETVNDLVGFSHAMMEVSPAISKSRIMMLNDTNVVRIMMTQLR